MRTFLIRSLTLMLVVGSVNAANVYTIYNKLVRASNVRQLPIHINEYDQFPNASTDGSSITVTRGLLNIATTNELAFVLGHEIAHAAYGYGEKGADIASLSIGSRAGYNACGGGISYFKKLIRRYGDKGDTAHQLTSIRIKYIQNICR